MSGLQKLLFNLLWI